MADEQAPPNRRSARVGTTYTDASGRQLTVTAVAPDDPLGREVRGELHSGASRRDFSTTLPIFAATWAPPGVKPPVVSDSKRGKW